jgi:PAS domain S-box-containing protein
LDETADQFEDRLSLLRKQAEDLVSQPAENLEELSRQQIIHELQVHQIELEMQNAELRRLEEEMAAACDRYMDLFDFAPSGYLVISDQKVVCEANFSAANMLGMERSRLVGSSIGRLIAREDQDTFYLQSRQAAAAQARQACEVLLVGQDGSYIPVRMEISPAKEGGKVFVTVQDISELKQTERELQQRVDEMSALREMMLELTTQHDLPTLLELIVERATRLLGVESGGMYLCDAGRREVRCVASYKTPRDYTGIVLKYGEGAAGVIAQSGEALIINDYRAWPDRARAFEAEQPFSAVLAAPMTWQGQVLGVLDVLHTQAGRGFTPRDLELLTLFANQAAVAVQNAHLFEDTQKEIVERKQTEKALQKSEAQLRAILDATPFPIALVDTQDNNIEFWSRNALTLFGHTAPTALEWYQIAYPDPDYRREVLERWKPALEEARLSGQAVNAGEYRVTCRNGSVRICELYAAFLADKLVVTFNDITERKQAEQALRASEERSHGLFENSPISLWEEDFSAVKRRLNALRKRGVKDFRAYLKSHPRVTAECASLVQITDVNQATLKLYQVRSKEELLKNLTIVLPREADEQFREQLVWIAEGKTQFSWEGVNQTLEGRMLDVSINWSAAPGHEKDLSKVIISIIDITERKRVVEKLEQEGILLRTLIDNLPDRVYVMDTQGRKIISNIADWQASGGKTMEDILGKTDLETYPPELAEDYWALDKAVMDSGISIFNREEPGLDSQGNPVWVLTSKVPLRDGQGKVIGLVGIGRDITEIKRTAEEIRQLNATLELRIEERTRELREAQEQLVRQEKLATLGQLAGGVGHGLRNPLGVIANAVYYLKMIQPEASDKVKQYHAILEEQTRAAEKIITDLLDYSRDLYVDRESLVASELAASVLQRNPASPGVKVEQDFEASLPRLYADSYQMTQVLSHLIVNAYQAMPKGGELTIRGRRSSLEEQPAVAISVSDTGKGIPPENMDKIFEPLFTTKPRGIGLGLAVCKKLVEANGGRIEVQSEPGQGSVFIVYLPARRL